MDYKFDGGGNVVSLAHPRYLFRYCPVNDKLYSALEEPYLWFSAIESLNDPFDCTTSIDDDLSDHEIRAYLDFGLSQLLKNIGSPELKAKIEAKIDWGVAKLVAIKRKCLT